MSNLDYAEELCDNVYDLVESMIAYERNTQRDPEWGYNTNDIDAARKKLRSTAENILNAQRVR